MTQDMSPIQAPVREEWNADGPSSGEGWLLFAGIILMTAGIMRLFDSIWAFSYNGVVPNNLQNSAPRPQSHHLWMGMAVHSHRPVRLRHRRHAAFAVCSLDRHHWWCDRHHQRHLVDALLSGLVTRLHRHRPVGHLHAGGPWRPGTSPSDQQPDANANFRGQPSCCHSLNFRCQSALSSLAETTGAKRGVVWSPQFSDRIATTANLRTGRPSTAESAVSWAATGSGRA